MQVLCDLQGDFGLFNCQTPVKIMLDDEEAYVSADYVTIAKKLDRAVTQTELKYGKGVSDVRVDLVNFAKQFLGRPYV